MSSCTFYVSLLLLLLSSPFISGEPPVASLRGITAFDSGLAFYSPVPLPAGGTCTAGQSYVVDSVQYLFEHARDLDCIFAAGKEPVNVPLGYGYGYLLSAANTGFWSSLLQIPYQGDYVVKTQCQGNFYNIGFLKIGGVDVGTAVWTIDNLGWNMAPGEYPEGDKKSLLMDFTVDFTKLCAPEGNESPIGLFGFSPFRNSVYPISMFKDIGRVVGVDSSDGATILLNKAIFEAEGLGAQTVLFYALKTFDGTVSPKGFSVGVPVEVPEGPNGEKQITYERAGAEGIMKKMVVNMFNPT